MGHNVFMVVRRTFTQEYRSRAARQVIDKDRPLKEVAREFDVSAGLLSRWVQAERDAMSPTEQRAELERLRRERTELLLENERLKRACGLL